MENRTWIIIGIVFFVGIIVLAAVVGLGYLFLQSNKAPATAPPVEEPATSTDADPGVEEPVEPAAKTEEPEVVPPSETPEPLPEFTSTPEFTATPEPVNRCELFDAAGTTLALHDIPIFTSDLTFYLDFGHPVPGLEEPVDGDEEEWVYSAILGSSPTEPCTVREYPGRIYCKVFDFPSSWWGTAQQLEVFVNGCDQPIFSHNRVSILKPACETTMAQDACQWTGGNYHCSGGVCTCNCP